MPVARFSVTLFAVLALQTGEGELGGGRYLQTAAA